MGKAKNFLKVYDNSGATVVKLLRNIGSQNNMTFFNLLTGSVFVVAVKKINRKNVKKKWIRRKRIMCCVIIKHKEWIRRFNGFFLKSRIDGAVMLKNVEDYQPIGNRIKTQIYFELRKRGFLKIFLISKYAI